MDKRKIVIFATLISIATSNATIKFYKDKSIKYIDHIVSYADSIEEDEYQIAAHRGFSSLEIENTKQAINLASSKSYIDIIEIDTRMTRDNKLVLSHNDNLLVRPNEMVYVSEMNYDTVTNTNYIYMSRQFHTLSLFNEDYFLIDDRIREQDYKHFHVVGLREGLEACKDKKVLLDLKFDNNKELLCSELKRELSGYDTSNIIFQSLDIEGIKYLQDSSDYNCQVLISRPQDLNSIEDFNNIGLKYTLINYEMIDSLLNQGKNICLWTIDNSVELRRVMNILGDHYKDVTYITDYPDLIVTKLHEEEPTRSLVK